MRIEPSRTLFGFSRNEATTRYLEIVYILFLPVAAWYLYQFSVFNNPSGFYDPWVYFGYVHNFHDLIERYGLPYYSVRFGLIFPLLAFVWLLGPIKGYMAFVYAMYLLAGIPLYLLFRKKFSIHAAALTYTILVASAWFARTVLWTHPDASGVPYLTAALAVMLLEAKHRRWASFTVGVLVALAANSNIFALPVGGLSAIAYLVYYKNTLWTSLRLDFISMAAGFLLIFAAGMMGYYVCCQQINFVSSTLPMIKWSMQGSGHIYQAPLSTLLKLNYLCLGPFLVLAMILILRTVALEYRSILFAAVSYLAAVLGFDIAYEWFTKTALLELFYYFSFLFAPSIVCMALVPIVLAKASNSEHQLLNLALVSFLIMPLIIKYGSGAGLYNVPIYLVCLSCAVTLLLILLAIRSKKITAYAIVCFVSSVQLSLVSTVIQGMPFYAEMYGGVGEVNLSRYRLGLKFIESIPKFNGDGRPVYFWYANADKLANSLQSTYLWAYSRLMNSKQGTKGLPVWSGVNLDLLRKRCSLVLFDRNHQIVDLGVEELRNVGVQFIVKHTTDICEGNICYTVAVLDVNGYGRQFDEDLESEAAAP